MAIYWCDLDKKKILLEDKQWLLNYILLIIGLEIFTSPMLTYPWIKNTTQIPLSTLNMLLREWIWFWSCFFNITNHVTMCFSLGKHLMLSGETIHTCENITISTVTTALIAIWTHSVTLARHSCSWLLVHNAWPWTCLMFQTHSQHLPSACLRSCYCKPLAFFRNLKTSQMVDLLLRTTKPDPLFTKVCTKCRGKRHQRWMHGRSKPLEYMEHLFEILLNIFVADGYLPKLPSCYGTTVVL